MNAQEAKKLTMKNKERQMKIEALIERGEENIKDACLKGRRRTSINPGYVDYNGIPEYPEVIEYFKQNNFELKYIHGTNLYDVFW